MGKENEKLKLTIELVPSTAWTENLRKYLSKKDWDKIRKETYAKAGYRCEICGVEGRMNCHEIWEYDDKNHIQKLLGFIALCSMCHHVKHIGFAGILAREGKLDYEKVVEHFMAVNNCDRRTFEEHRKRAFLIWEERSKYEWKIDLGDFHHIFKKRITEHKEL